MEFPKYPPCISGGNEVIPHYRYSNFIDSMNFRTERDKYTHFLIAGETEVSEDN